VSIVELEQVVRNVNDRVTRIEQILPTLATKEDLKAFATKEDLKAFATRDELREEGDRTRRHFDAVAERLEGHIQLISEGQVALQEQFDGFKKEMRSDIAGLDRRLMRLEAFRA
jgi:hypothetical protein